MSWRGIVVAVVGAGASASASASAAAAATAPAAAAEAAPGAEEAAESSEGVEEAPTATGPGIGIEALGLVYLRADPIDGGPLSLGAGGGLLSLDVEAAFGPLLSPEHGLRLAAELLVVRTAWGEGEGTDALEVTQTSWLASPRARAGWAFGRRLQLQPFLSFGPAVTRSEVTYRLADPAVGTQLEESHAGWLPGFTSGLGALVTWPLDDALLLQGRLELDVIRRGGATDAAFAAGLGLQVGHVTPRAR